MFPPPRCRCPQRAWKDRSAKLANLSAPQVSHAQRPHSSQDLENVPSRRCVVRNADFRGSQSMCATALQIAHCSNPRKVSSFIRCSVNVTITAFGRQPKCSAVEQCLCYQMPCSHPSNSNSTKDNPALYTVVLPAMNEMCSRLLVVPASNLVDLLIRVRRRWRCLGASISTVGPASALAASALRRAAARAKYSYEHCIRIHEYTNTHMPSTSRIHPTTVPRVPVHVPTALYM